MFQDKLLHRLARRPLEDVLGQLGAVAIEEADGAEVAAEYFYRVVIGDETWESLPAPYQDMVRANGPAIVAELRGAWLEVSADDLVSVTAPVLIVSGDGSPSAFRLVDDEREGRVIRVRAGYARIDALLAYLTENCCAGAATCGPGSACGPKKTGAKR